MFVQLSYAEYSVSWFGDVASESRLLRSKLMAKHQRAQHVGIEFNSTSLLKEQLIREITSLERQRDNVRLVNNTVDFSMLQTYKEMIHCRREMLSGLPR